MWTVRCESGAGTLKKKEKTFIDAEFKKHIDFIYKEISMSTR